MDKPDVDSIEGLSPAISIDQKTTLAQPALDRRHRHRDLRLPAPAVGARRPSATATTAASRSQAQSAEQIIDRVMELDEGTKFMVLAPIVRGRKGEYGEAVRAAARRRLRAREGRRRDAPARRGRADRARQEVQARHLGRGRPPGDAARTCASGSPTRSRRRSALADGLVEIETVDETTSQQILLFSREVRSA